jgi:signal transduction histidine kinase
VGWLQVRRPVSRDAAAAVVFAAVWFGGIWLAHRHGRLVYLDRRSLVVCGISTILVLLFRQAWPRATLVAVVLIYPSRYGTWLASDFFVLPLLLAGYTAAAKGSLRTIWVLLLALSGVTLALIPPESWWFVATHPRDLGQYNLSRIATLEILMAATVLLGRAAYRQRLANLELRQRHRELDRLGSLETDQVVSAERTRIARELHDVVAHHISAVVIRAQAADRVADARPEETRAAVRWIATNGQETLAAMRHVVRVLRSTETGGSLAPQATLAELPEIAARMSAVGLPVELRLPEVTPVLPAAVELATVRIIQEALTNVLVHAEATRAMVEVRFGPGGEFRVEVHDNGSAATAPAPVPATPVPPIAAPSRSGLGGNGLIGMRERAASCGGTLTIGASPLGGWLVTAVLRSSLVGLSPITAASPMAARGSVSPVAAWPGAS